MLKLFLAASVTLVGSDVVSASDGHGDNNRGRTNLYVLGPITMAEGRGDITAEMTGYCDHLDIGSYHRHHVLVASPPGQPVVYNGYVTCIVPRGKIVR